MVCHYLRGMLQCLISVCFTVFAASEALLLHICSSTLWGAWPSQQFDNAYLQVVSAPVIGKVAQVGIERVVGTVIGGWTGYAVYMLGSTVWNTTTDGMLHSHQRQSFCLSI